MGKPQRSLQITIDSQTYLVAPGTTVLDVAKEAGLVIPTLCHLDTCKPPASCMVCLVKDLKTDANLPSCATKVVDGMQIESETEKVHALRRTAIELLLSDHVGDCLAPCTLACPLNVDIPSVVRMIRAGNLQEAAQLLRRQLPMATLLERLCTKPCEKACRRGRHDRAVVITTLHQTITTEDKKSSTDATKSNRRIAIVGSGMAGLTAAHFLRYLGYAVTIFEQTEQLGGRLREEMVLAGLPDEMLDDELDRLQRRGITFKLRSSIDPKSLEKLLKKFDAVLIASGPQSKNLFSEQLKHAACFTAGDAVKPEMSFLRRAVSGRDAAAAINRLLSVSGGACPRIKELPINTTANVEANKKDTFSVRLGKLSEAEMNLFVEEVDSLEASDLSLSKNLDEAARCFLCDCSDLANCQLRQVAIEYNADPRRYKVPRRELVRQRTPGGIVFEPGKCIRCGRCIEIIKQDPNASGLTFSGRGFDVILSTPINRTLDESLGRMADACCEACPTGALVKSSRPPCKVEKEA